MERKPTKQVHSFEFKLALVRQFLAGEGTQPDLAHMRQLSSPKLLGKWIQIYREQGEDGLPPKAKGRPKSVPGTAGSEASELEKLRQENQRLAAENAYLKNTSLEEPTTALKVSAVMDLKASHALPLLLQAAGLARSTFFYRQAALKTPDRHAALRASIHKIFTAARGRYGYRRIHAALRRQGWQVAGKTVLKREFATEAPNTKWVTDVTEFKVAEQKVYLSPILDLFDRSIAQSFPTPSPSRRPLLLPINL